ncbi:hypothetical protein NDU88_003549 [Pleurodeles waltl]|uniref:Uncharacterized protein n=1 Tax=Pleurodeles waltl TaxID=8319 RepID=A0AAV7L697_PLEWA|nr:hypothetical protein NDU88_003549 [Pleurodeles waltl]
MSGGLPFSRCAPASRRHLAPSSARQPSYDRSLVGAGSSRLDVPKDNPPLTAHRELRRSARSRLQPPQFYRARSARASPSAIARLKMAPRASLGSGTSRAPQAALSVLRPPPPPSRWFRCRGGMIFTPAAGQSIF